MASHYVFEPEFCNPGAGREKGQVEKNVLDTRRLILQLMPDFPDLAALNAWLEQRCIEQWERTPHGTLPGTSAAIVIMMRSLKMYGMAQAVEEASRAELADTLARIHELMIRR